MSAILQKMAERRYSIGEVAQRIGRVPHTVRVWELYGRLPEHLRGVRDSRGWRYWTDEQITGIKQWMIDEDMRPGKGLHP